MVLYSGLLRKHHATSFSDLSLQPHQQKVFDYNFQTENPDIRFDNSYTELLLTKNFYYFKHTVRVRMRIYCIYFPLSFYSSKVHTCHFIVPGQPPTGFFLVEKNYFVNKNKFHLVKKNKNNKVHSSFDGAFKIIPVVYHLILCIRF